MCKAAHLLVSGSLHAEYTVVSCGPDGEVGQSGDLSQAFPSLCGVLRLYLVSYQVPSALHGGTRIIPISVTLLPTTGESAIANF